METREPELSGPCYCFSVSYTRVHLTFSDWYPRKYPLFATLAPIKREVNPMQKPRSTNAYQATEGE
jgi:hypothetical protein